MPGGSETPENLKYFSKSKKPFHFPGTVKTPRKLRSHTKDPGPLIVLCPLMQGSASAPG
jgi:hypothetical protein